MSDDYVKPPPPWACEVCHLVNWPNWEDGSPAKVCRGCGRVRPVAVTIDGVDVTHMLDFEVVELDGLSVTVEEFLKSDPWEV